MRVCHTKLPGFSFRKLYKSVAFVREKKNRKMPPPILIFLLVLISPSRGEIFERVHVALDKVLDFMYENREVINLDGLFGVALGRAQLQSAISETPQDSPQIVILKIEDEKARKFLKNGNAASGRGLSKAYKLFSQHLVNPKIWRNYTQFPVRLLLPVKQTSKPLISCVEYKLLLNNNSFNETASDICLVELINSRVTSSKCQITTACQDFMISEDVSTDYTILHRLLYLQVAKALACDWKLDFFQNKILSYCNAIYHETQVNYKCADNSVMDDVFLEQVLLCGMEGFGEFFERMWMERVLDMQTEYGCYGVSDEIMRKKREANVIKGGCVDHTTGLAAGALSLFLRYLAK